jgi:hypothetical protein
MIVRVAEDDQSRQAYICGRIANRTKANWAGCTGCPATILQRTGLILSLLHNSTDTQSNPDSTQLRFDFSGRSLSVSCVIVQEFSRLCAASFDSRTTGVD